jgi:heme exporter protein D
MLALNNWLSMGTYTPYVWSAYGVVCAMFIFNGLACRWHKKRTHKTLTTWFNALHRK